MRDPMIADQQRRFALEQAATALARVAIARENHRAQRAPARRLVPTLPRRLLRHAINRNRKADCRQLCSWPVWEETYTLRSAREAKRERSIIPNAKPGAMARLW